MIGLIFGGPTQIYLTASRENLFMPWLGPVE